MPIKLLTKELKKQIPPLGATEGTPFAKKTIVTKFFLPGSNWTWYVAEASALLEDYDEVPLTDPRAKDAADVTFFGLVDGMEREWGYFSLKEHLLEARSPFGGLPVERDLYWTPRTLTESEL